MITDLTDDGLALELARAWAGDARYDTRRRRWSFRDGAAWVRDDTLLHVTRARDFLRAKALAAGGDERLRSVRTVAAVIRLASLDEALARPCSPQDAG
jgi:hypothetical protein